MLTLLVLGACSTTRGQGGQAGEALADDPCTWAAGAKSAEVLIATRNLYPGLPITSADVEQRKHPVVEQQRGKLLCDVEQIDRLTPRRVILAGEPLRVERLAGASEPIVPSDVVRPGNRAITLRVGPEQGWGPLQTGDHVDIYVLAPRDAGCQLSQLSIQGVRVIAIDDELYGRADLREPAGTVTLEMNPDEVAVLAPYTSGQFVLTPRSPIDIRQAPTWIWEKCIEGSPLPRLPAEDAPEPPQLTAAIAPAACPINGVDQLLAGVCPGEGEVAVEPAKVTSCPSKTGTVQLKRSASGRTSLIQNDARGRHSGATCVFQDGVLLEVATYSDGELNGARWQAGPIQMSEQYASGSLDGVQVQSTLLGWSSLYEYSAGELDGPFYVLYDGNVVTAGNHAHGQLDGMFHQWTAQGTYAGGFEFNEGTGLWVERDPAGKPLYYTVLDEGERTLIQVTTKPDGGMTLMMGDLEGRTQLVQVDVGPSGLTMHRINDGVSEPSFEPPVWGSEGPPTSE